MHSCAILLSGGKGVVGTCVEGYNVCVFTADCANFAVFAKKKLLFWILVVKKNDCNLFSNRTGRKVCANRSSILLVEREVPTETFWLACSGVLCP